MFNIQCTFGVLKHLFMKVSIIITTVFALIMTMLLVECRNQGLHPNMKAFGIMIPFIATFVWARFALRKN